MRYVFLALATLSFVASANAQMPAQPYAAPDEATWNQMATALGTVPTSKDAHMQIDNILNSVQQIAQRAKMQAEAAAKAAKSAEPPKDPTVKK